jgi:hypothetical protein
MKFSTIQITPKLCISCKFYTKKFFTVSGFGKCSLFPKDKVSNYFLVNGIKKNNNTDYYYCNISRNYEHMCGKEGKFYEKK